MAAHRFWKADQFRKPGGEALELSEFHLLAAGSRVDGAAVLTATQAPTSGSLSALKDDDTETGATWAAHIYQTVELTWDFGGSPVGVEDIRLGSQSRADRFLRDVRIQYSDDGIAWSTYYTFRRIRWPGARLKTSSSTKLTAVTNTTVYRHLHAEFEGVAGATTFVDSSANAVTLTGVGGPALTADDPSPWGGTTSLRLNGTSQYVDLTPNTKFLEASFPDGGFCSVIEFEFQVLGFTPGVTQYLFNRTSSSSYTEYVTINGNGCITSSWGTVGPAVTDGKWHKFIVQNRYRAQSLYCVMEIFLDGERFAYQQTSAFRVGAPTVNSWIGSGRTSSNSNPLGYFNGKIKGVMVYEMQGPENRVLSDYVPVANGFGAGLATIDTDLFAVRAPLMLARPIVGGEAPALRSGGRGGPLPRSRKDFTIVTGLQIGRVSGDLKKAGAPALPVSRRTRLYRDVDGALVRQIWSRGGDGKFSFDWVDETQKYTVVAHDYEFNYRAVIADNLTPDLIENIAPSAPQVKLRSAVVSFPANSGSTNMQFGAVVEGDLMVAVVQGFSTAGPGAFAADNWTLAASSPTLSGRTTFVYYRRGRTADNGSSLTTSWTFSGPINATVLVFYQSDGKAPQLDQALFSPAWANGNSAPLPNITQRNGESYVVGIGSSFNANVGVPTVAALASTSTEWARASNLEGYVDMRLAAFTRALVDTPSETTGVWSTNQTAVAPASNNVLTGIVIVKPAP